MKLRYFELGNHVLGFVATSKIDKELVDDFHAEIKERLEKYDKIRIFCENASGKSVSVKATFKHFLFKLKHRDRFEKIAIVSNTFEDKLKSQIECSFLKAECHFYKSDERTEALQWISD